MREIFNSFVKEALPELHPIISHELTDYGWRGITKEGEVLEVRGTNGHAIEVPDEITVAFRGTPIGRRAVRNDIAVDINDYLSHFNAAVALYKNNHVAEALIEADATLRAAPTLRAKFNRAMVLLALGRWDEGLDEYWQCEQEAPFIRPQVRAALDAGLQPWRGEDLSDKKLLVLHAHGFGDTIQMLRYVQPLWEMGVNVRLDVPVELQRLADKFAPPGRFPPPNIRSSPPLIERPPDYFCPILHLLHFLHVTPENVDGSPYIEVEPTLVERWRGRLPEKSHPDQQRIGIAWSIGKPSDGDYPREIPLQQLVKPFGFSQLHSVQVQGADEARAIGVHVHEFADFADCAALMLQMDMIVSVDTAALHLAGAIGHRNVVGLLSHWASWRWVAPWYANLHICRQPTAGDWAGALAQIRKR